MKKSSRVISTLLLGATLTTFSTGVFAVESQKVVKEKLAGATRYETNLAVSAKWEKAETVILVEGYAIPDALAATPLAKQKDAPILLTETAKLTKATADEITRLGAKNAIIVGGEGVVSKEVEKDLEAMNVKVTRLAGQSRFETSEAVVKEMGEVSKVAVVNGYGESDALSIAAPAAKDGMAIVLAGKDELKGSADVVKNAKEKYVIGGEGVVSEKLQKEIGAERLGGATRNETNAAILDKFYSEKEIENLYVAKDGNPKTTELVDALGVGPLAGKEGNPVMLAGAKASAGQLEYLKDKTAKKVTEVGNGINATTLADIVKALEVKDVTPEPDKAEVTGVKVINADQIEVKFNKKVDKDSAELSDNYTIKDDDGKDIKAAPVKDTETGFKAEVADDNETVILTLNQKYQKDGFRNQETIRVKVENVMTEDKSEVFEKYENKNIRLFDNTLPELKEIKQVGPKEFDLVFSEPVTAENNSELLSAIRINNGEYNFNAQTRIENSDLDSNVVRIKTSSELKDGEYNFEIKENKIMDYAGLKLEKVDTKLNVKKDTTALTASVYKVSNNKATLKFNKEVENAEHYFVKDKEEGNTNVDYYLDYANNDAFKANSAKMVDGKLEVSFDKPIPTGNHKIVVVYDNENDDKVQDLWEQELSTKEISFTVAKDTIAPTATVTYDKKDKDVIEVKFSEEVTGADQMSAYELKDSKGNYVNISKIEPKKENNLVYRLLLEKDLDGSYTLKIKKNKIYDTSVEKNMFEEKTYDLATLDQTPATVTSVTFGGKEKDKKDKIYVEFSEDMKTSGEGSILDKKLYSINGTNLDDIEDAKIESNTKSSVIITMPEDDVANKYEVIVGRVCDANGNFAGVAGTLGERNAKEDSIIEFIDGTSLNEKDILDEGYKANIISDNKVEVFLKGRIIAGDAKKITYGAQTCKEVNRDVIKVEQKENGKDLVVTKVTLKFEDDTFVTQGQQDLTNFVFEADAFTTALETKTDEIKVNDTQEKLKTLKADDKAEADYKDNAVILKDGDQAKQIRIELTEKVKPVTKNTFAVEGFEVESVDGTNNGSTGVVLLNVKARQFTESKPNVRVEQKEAIHDLKDNKTTGMSFSIKSVTTYAVENVKAKIAALPADITLANKDAVVAARTAYDALTKEEQASVDKTKLEAAEAKIVELESAASQAKIDAVKAKIAALPADITLANKDAVVAARTAYDALTKEEQASVDKTKLEAAEAKISESEAKVNAVKAKILALPEESAIEASNKDEVQLKVTEARTAYDALTQAEKDAVGDITKLTAAEAKLKTL